ncbi:MAG: PAS domain-containing protein [Firmicutes bacterium]|nr:PAS domain-containing protein [Dethiobacter sp.]MBS3889288.1 PAS domain-containing protein [Bacillota bacterium]MBS4053168.1 PAS domain-containing protein [Thermaerobacter sp.]
MGAIQVRQGYCKSCYACIRACEVKATSIRRGQASIIDDDCLSCGECLAHCPQKAREIRSDIEVVRNLLKGVTPLWASLAPAAAVGKYTLLEWETRLMRAGFAGVSLTSWGAVPVAAAYNEAALREGWVLTTACPAAVKLVCRFFPTLTSHLAPVASPMLTHAAWLKETHKAKVVFIGPCAAKKTEAQGSTHMAAALTFAEVLPLLAETSPAVDREHASLSFSAQGLMHFPVPAGLASAVDVPVLAVDGVSDLWGFLRRVERGETTPRGIVEMSACRGSCLGGPAAFCRDLTLSERRAMLVTLPEGRVHSALPLRRHFLPQPVLRNTPSDAAVADVLNLLGKADKATEYNCGACGYHTCRDKALAVVNGRAELEMCLPYMRTKAESLANLILASTPNAVILVDRELHIREWNAAAERLFGIPEAHALHRNIADFLPAEDYAALFANSFSIPGKKISVIPGVVTLFTASLVKGGELAMGIYTDITRLEEQGQALLKVRQETIERAQEVINKQMRVAQEIASLLGETTAESKVLLLKLMKVVQGDAK